MACGADSKIQNNMPNNKVINMLLVLLFCFFCFFFGNPDSDPGADK